MHLQFIFGTLAQISTKAAEDVTSTFAEAGPLWMFVAIFGGVLLYLLYFLVAKYLPRVHENNAAKIDALHVTHIERVDKMISDFRESLLKIEEHHTARVNAISDRHADERAQFAKVIQDFTEELRSVKSTIESESSDP